MGSKRLPNKMMLYLHGHPICEWVYKRVIKSKKINHVIFAIPDNKENNVLYLYLKSIGANVFKGSEKNVVDRFYNAAHAFAADRVIRICADNPLVCPLEIDRLVDFFDNSECDYAYNHIPKNNNYPDGFGAEICPISILDKIHQAQKSEQQQEHVFNYILDNKSKFVIKTFDAPKYISYPKLKLDIDTISDYQKMMSFKISVDMTSLEIVKTILNFESN